MATKLIKGLSESQPTLSGQSPETSHGRENSRFLLPCTGNSAIDIRKAQAEEYESHRQQATYVTPRELKLAERFKKKGRIPSDPLDKLRMEYGLMWQCYEVDKSTNPPSAKQRSFPSKEELTRCRLAILHPEEIDRIVIGSDLKFIPKSEFYKDWNQSLRFAHKFNQPKEKGQSDTY
jgi:hypothetical protein